MALVVLVVVVLALAASATVVVRALADDGAVRVGMALAGVAVLAVLLLGALAGLRGGEDSSDSHEPADEPDPPSTAPARGTTPLRPAEIHLVSPRPGALPPVPKVMGDLRHGDVVVVEVAGLEPHSRATVHQCPTAALAAGSCRAGLPITASGQGLATLLVDLHDRLDVLGAAEVDCREPGACSIVVFGSARLEVITVFGGPAPPPIVIRAEPARIPPGGTVTASAERLAPGSAVSFVVCRPSRPGEADCGTPTEPVRVDETGEATASVTVGAGRCPRGGTCAVAVVVDDGGPVAFAHLQLIGRSGAAYADGRVQAGLAVAVAFLLLAGWVLKRTDWAPVEGDPFAGVHLPEDPFADVPDP